MTSLLLLLLLLRVKRFVVGGLGFEFCVFVAGWRHALRNEWPFIIIITGRREGEKRVNMTNKQDDADAHAATFNVPVAFNNNNN